MPATARRKLGQNVQVSFFFPFRLLSLPFHSFFDFGNLTGCSFPVLVNASPVEWIANSRPNPVAGHVVPVVRPPLKSTRIEGSRTPAPYRGWLQPLHPFYLSFVSRDVYVPSTVSICSRLDLLQNLGILCCVAFPPCFFFLFTSIEGPRGLWGC